MTTDRGGKRKAMLPSCRYPEGPTTDRAERAAIQVIGTILLVLLVVLVVLES
jgi:hypothetical protein